MDTLIQNHTQILSSHELAGVSAQRIPDDVVGVTIPPAVNKGGKFSVPNYEVIDSDTGEVKLICPTGQNNGECILIPISKNSLHPYAAITDYLNCTFKFNPKEESLTGLFQEILHVFGNKFFPVIERKYGIHRYEKSFSLGESSALLAIGGQAGTVLLTMSGESCSLLHDKWAIVVDYLKSKRNARITRWDGAVDDYSGSHSVDWAVEQYLQGNFNAGGNKPSCSNAGNWTDPQGKGRTFYVGKRKNGKFFRVYEKGMQLGSVWHPWVRWEVELHNKDRIIPWDVLLNPARYFVGSYPRLLKWVQDEMTPIRTIQKQMQISYEHLTEYASIAYGSHISLMLKVEGSHEAVFNKLKRNGTSKRMQHPLPDKISDFIAKDDSNIGDVL